MGQSLLPEKIDKNPEFQKALELMEKTKKNVFITGRAGTGKSTLLAHFKLNTEKNVVVLAPTGVAAVNVSGQTIHSFFGFSPGITVKEAKRRALENASEIYNNLDAIVIDEISMVRADLLDCVDEFLRIARDKVYLPFGGVQMIFFGDLYQLPPVVKGKEEMEIFRSHYPSEFFFDSRAFRSAEFESIELVKVYRQEEEFFVELLNKIRDNTITDEDIDLINLAVFEDEKSLPGNAVYLTTTNANADEVNWQKLSKLQGKLHTFNAFVTGEFDKNAFPTEEVLYLKEGAQVMLLNNDREKRWVNGTIAKIRKIKKECLIVEIPGRGKEEVYPFTWENYRFFLNKKKKIESKVVGTFKQFPVTLAWAITIHKSQGKTFDKVVVDIGNGAFAPGQVYVALSRCRTLDGLFLKKAISKKDIWVDWRVVKFTTLNQEGSYKDDIPHKEKIKVIKKAISKGLDLEIAYINRRGEVSVRLVHPEAIEESEYAGVKFEGLRAYCFKRKDHRTFRIDRILEIKVKN